MAKNSVEAYGASGKTNLLIFDPDVLVLVEDKASPLYDDRVHLPIDEAMVLNIMYQGVLEPILVAKNPETGGTEVVVGRQRVKCAREANRRLVLRGDPPIQVPATVRRGDPLALASAMVSENELRREDTPLGRAKKMAAMLERGSTEDHLSVVFGCSVRTVQNTLKLLDATAAVRHAVESGKLGMNQAVALAKLEPEEQRAKVAELTQATDGLKGHAKAKAVRKVVSKGESKGEKLRRLAQAVVDAYRNRFEVDRRGLTGPIDEDIRALAEALE